MLDKDRELEKIVLTRLMQLNGSIVGIILGLCFGLGIFAATNILLIKGGEVVGPHLSLLGQFFIGYQVSFLGSLIGLLYGFVIGFITGFVFAHLYNWFANLRDRSREAAHR